MILHVRFFADKKSLADKAKRVENKNSKIFISESEEYNGRQNN